MSTLKDQRAAALMNTVPRDRVATVLQTALLGEVSPLLQGVAFSIGTNDVRIAFYYDGPISEEDRESTSFVVTEVIVGFPSTIKVYEDVRQVDHPVGLPHHDHWTYRRRE